MPIFHICHQITQPGSPFSPGQTRYLVESETQEQEGEAFIVKRVNSSFIGTDLEARLRAAGIHTAVICNSTTNHCVETATRMAGNLGFDTWLVRDATWTLDRIGPDGDNQAAEEPHQMTMASLHEEFARIVTTAEVLAALF